MYRCLDLYNAYERLPREHLSGLQYPQFQIFVNLVLIPKSAEKKSVNHMLYRNNILQEKVFYHRHMHSKGSYNNQRLSFLQSQVLTL